MFIGIDASRANQERRTGTEWYAFHVINEIIRQAPPTDRIVLYVKDSLVNDWPALPSNVSIRVLRWPPKFMWTQFRLAWEIFLHSPKVLFVPAHTIPILCPQKTITTLHDVGFEMYPELYSEKSIGPRWLSVLMRIVSANRLRADELSYHRWSARLAIRKAAQVVTVSEFSKKEIIDRFKVEPSHIQVVACGYNTEYIQMPEHLRAVIRKKYNLNKPFLLYIGRIEKKKNISNMVTAFEKFKVQNPQYDFIFIGNLGYGSSEIEAKIQSSPVRDSIRKLGWVPTNELPVLMNCARAFIFVTAYEGFGIPNLEAMACQIPVLTSNQGATAEVVGDGALTVNPRDPQAISDGMGRIVRDEQLRKQLIAKGLVRLHTYSWQKAGKRLLEIIQSLA